MRSIFSSDLKNDLDYCIFPTRNLINIKAGGYTNSGIFYLNNTGNIPAFLTDLTPGKYAVSLKINTDVNYNSYASFFRVCTSINYSLSTRIISQMITSSTRYFTFEVEETIRSIWIFARDTVSQSETQTLILDYIQLEKIDDLEEPQHNLILPITNSDYIARERIYLEPSDDPELNRINVEGMLNYYGYCNLGPGTFYFDRSIQMPKYTKLSGCGDSTKLMIDSSSADQAVLQISSRCIVENLAFRGSESDIELDGVFVAKYKEEDSSVNLWTNNSTQSITGYDHIVLNTPLQPGAYAVLAEVSGIETSAAYIAFSTSKNASIGPSNIKDQANFYTSAREIHYVYFDKPVYSVRISSAQSTSTSITTNWSNIRIYPVGNYSGIVFQNANADLSFATPIVSKCSFAHFNCAGIYVINTSTPVDRNIIISDCTFYNNNVGIFLAKDAEFARISNCSIYRNYIGYYNRGGNNNIDTCGIDANVIGILIDDIIGSNGGHGTICNCSINHSDSNEGYGLTISGTGRMLVSNCNIYFSKIKLENTDGNVISNCGFGRNSGWEIIGGNCSIFTNCMIRTLSDTPITVTDNTTIKVIDCYTRSGVAITPTIV